jgi:hypothetical protein
MLEGGGQNEVAHPDTAIPDQIRLRAGGGRERIQYCGLPFLSQGFGTVRLSLRGGGDDGVEG